MRKSDGTPSPSESKTRSDALEARMSARRPLSSTVMYGAGDKDTWIELSFDATLIWRDTMYNDCLQRFSACLFRQHHSVPCHRPPSASPTFRNTAGILARVQTMTVSSWCQLSESSHLQDMLPP